MCDRDTFAYFNDHTPEYSVGRYHHAVEAINRYGVIGASLIDIGCGCGNVLEFVHTHTKVGQLAGIDISEKYLSQCRTRLDLETFCGSILDSGFVKSINQRYDFAILGAVLHHLVGNTRVQSRYSAKIRITLASSLLIKFKFL